MVGFLELIDNTLGTHFNAKVYDKKKGRAKMVALIDKAADQRNKGLTPPTRSWKTGSNGAVKFTPTLNGKPVLIGGTEANYVAGDRFQDFLDGLKAAVEAGDLDAEIKAALDGEKGKATGGKGSGKGGITPEAAAARGIAAAATRKRNKEAREAALKA